MQGLVDGSAEPGVILRKRKKHNDEMHTMRRKVNQHGSGSNNNDEQRREQKQSAQLAKLVHTIEPTTTHVWLVITKRTSLHMVAVWLLSNSESNE